MNIEQGHGPIVSFSGQRRHDTDCGAPLGHAIDYCRKREQAERAAAKRSVSVVARRVHQELAEAYAELIRKGARP